jgi:hypothetical protein
VADSVGFLQQILEQDKGGQGRQGGQVRQGGQGEPVRWAASPT